jgi:hypothetical protein
MVSKISALAVSVCVAVVSYSQTVSDQEQIKQVIQNSFDDLWAAAKLDKVSQYYSSDFMLVENGTVWNTDSVSMHLTKMQRRSNRPQRTNKIDIIKVDVDGDHAKVAYFNEATFVFTDKPNRSVRWLESAALKKLGSTWKVHLLHSTLLTPKN